MTVDHIIAQVVPLAAIAVAVGGVLFVFAGYFH